MGTFYFDLVGGTQKDYLGLKAVVDELGKEWHLLSGPQTGGWSDGGIEHLAFQYVDLMQREFVLLKYNNMAGKYRGTLKVALSAEQFSQLQSRAGVFLSAVTLSLEERAN